MKRLRVILPVCAVTLAAGVIIATQLNLGGTEAQLREERYCNTILPAPEGELTVTAGAPFIEDPNSPGNPILGNVEVRLKIRRPGVGPDSGVVLDAATGSLTRDVVAPVDRGAFDAFLNQKRVEPVDPSTAPWPYGSSNGGDPTIIDREGDPFTYREPDPGSGFILLGYHGDSANSSTEGFFVTNCRSQVALVAEVYIDGRVERKVYGEYVLPEDRAAFDAFMAEFKVRKPAD